MNNDEMIIKEAAASLTAFKIAFIALSDVLKTIRGGKTAAFLLENWKNLSNAKKILELRNILKTTPGFFKTVPKFSASMKNIVVGGKAPPTAVVEQMGKVTSSIVKRLRAIANPTNLKNSKPYIDRIEDGLKGIQTGVVDLHKFMQRTPNMTKHQEKINGLLKSGQFNEVGKFLTKKFGTAIKTSEGKVIVQLPEDVTAIVNNLNKFNNVTAGMQQLQQVKFISPRQYSTLLNSVMTLSAPGSLAGSLKALSYAQTAPILGFVALGALKGDSQETIKEHSQIAAEIFKLLKELPGDNNPAGKAWEAKKQEVITKLSEIDTIDLTKLDKININEVSLDEAAEALEGVIDPNSPNNIQNKMETILEAYLTIISPNFYTLYENGSQGIAQTVGEAVDTATGWIFGNVTAFNQIKALAQKGATKLPESAQKIARDARMISMRIQKHVAENSQPTEVTAITEYDGFVKEAQAFNAIHDIVAIRVKKAQLKKEGAAVFAAIGMVAGWLGTISLATDLGNYVMKTYISMGEGWRDLSKNIEEVTSHLNGFISVEDEDEDEDEDANNFIIVTKEMIQELNDSYKSVATNFPLDLIKTFEDGISATDKPAIMKLSKEIVNGTTKTKLEVIKNGLKKISNIYDVIINPQSGYYTQFDNTVESYWHGFVEVFDLFTFFTGEAAVSEFKRMIYKAKRGQAIANTLLNEVESVNKTFNETRISALEESSKSLEEEEEGESLNA